MAEEIVIRIGAQDNASDALIKLGKQLGGLKSAGDNASAGMRGMASSTASMAKAVVIGNVASQVLLSTMKAVAGAMTKSVRAISSYGDQWLAMTNSIALYAKSAEEAAQVQEELYHLANRTRAAIGPTVELYQRLAMSNDSLMLTQEEMIKVTGAVNQAIMMSGSTASSAASAVMQLGQALASDTLAGDELRSIRENAPALFRAIAEGAGVSAGELRKMGSQGKLTGEVVTQSLLKMADTLQGRVGKAIPTLGIAFTHLSNAMVRFFGNINKATDFNKRFGAVINGVAETLEKMNLTPIIESFKILMESLDKLLPSGVAAQGFLDSILSWIPAIVQMTARFVDATGIIVDSLKLVSKTMQIVKQDIATISWLKLLYLPFKMLAQAVANVGVMIAHMMINLQKIVTAGIALLISPFTSTFIFIFDWIAKAFQKYVIANILSGVESMIRKIAEWVPAGLADKLTAFADSVGGAVKKYAAIDLPGEKEFKLGVIAAVTDQYKELKKAIVALGTGVSVDFDTIFADAFATLNELLMVIDPTGELSKELVALQARVGALAAPIVTEFEKVINIQKETGSVAEKTAPQVATAWENALTGIKNGIADYKKELGTFAKAVAEATSGMFTAMEEGIQGGVSTMLFGREDKGAIRDARRQLRALFEESADFSDFSQFVTGVGEDPLAQTISNFEGDIDRFNSLLESAGGEDIPEKFKRRIEDLQGAVAGFKLGGITEEEVGKFREDVDKLADDLGGELGLLGTFRQAGAKIKDAFVLGFQTNLINLLTNRIMVGLLSGGTGLAGKLAGMFDPVASELKSALSKPINSMFATVGLDLTSKLKEVNIGGPLTSLFDPAPDFTSMKNALNSAFKGVDTGGNLGAIMGGSGADEYNKAGRFHWIKTGLNAAFGGVKTGLSFLWDSISTPFKWIGSQLQAAFDSLSTENLNKFWTATTDTFTALKNGLAGAFDIAIPQAAKNMWSATSATFSALKSGLASAFNIPLSYVVTRMWSATSATFSALKSGLASAFNVPLSYVVTRMWSATSATFSALKSGLAGAFDIAIPQAAKNMWSANFASFASLKGALTDAFNVDPKISVKNMWSATSATFSALKSGLAGAFDIAIPQAAKNMWSATSATFSALKSGLASAFNMDLKDSVKNLWSVTETTFSVLGKAIKNALDVSPDSNSLLSKVWSAAATSLSDFGSAIKNALGMKPGTDSLIHKVFNTTASMLSALKSGLEAVFGGLDLSLLTGLFDKEGTLAKAFGGGLASALVIAVAASELGSQISTAIGTSDVGGRIGGILAAQMATALSLTGPLGLAVVAIGAAIGGGIFSSFAKLNFAGKKYAGITGEAIEAFKLGGVGMMDSESLKKQQREYAKADRAGKSGAIRTLAEEIGKQMPELNEGERRDMAQALLTNDYYGERGIIINAYIRKGLKAAYDAEMKRAETMRDIANWTPGADWTPGGEVPPADWTPGGEVPPADWTPGGEVPPVVDPPSPVPKPVVPPVVTKAISFGAAFDAMMFQQLPWYLKSIGMSEYSAEWNNALAWITDADNRGREYLRSQGWTINARQGLGRVPGSESTPVPAILHGGERVLTADQARQQDAGGVTVNVIIQGNGDEALLRLIRERAIPEIQRSIEGSLKTKSRFGQFSMDSRSIRKVMVN